MYATQIHTLAALVKERLATEGGPTAITALLDIEGTTTALPFVTKVLFPYAEASLDPFVRSMYDSVVDGSHGGLKANIADLSADAQLFAKALNDASADINGGDADGPIATPEALIALLRQRMAENSKVPYLKQVQGVIWRTGYVGGQLKGHVFADAVTFMQVLSANTLTNDAVKTSVEIYSSGSIAAQKLLFGNSTSGDLCPYIVGYHDPTTVGLKTEAASYSNLARAVATPLGYARKTAFFTDSISEVEACVASGAIDLCVFLRRPLNNPVTDAHEARLAALRVPSITSLAQFVSALSLALSGADATGEAGRSDKDVAAELEAQVSQFVGAGELKTFV